MPISQTEDRSESVLCRFREECTVFLWVDLEYLSPFSLLYFLWCFSEECARRASGVRGWKQFHGAQQHSRCRAPAQMAVVWLFFGIYHFRHLPFTKCLFQIFNKYLVRTNIVIEVIWCATTQLVSCTSIDGTKDWKTENFQNQVSSLPRLVPQPTCFWTISRYY